MYTVHDNAHISEPVAIKVSRADRVAEWKNGLKCNYRGKAVYNIQVTKAC